VFDCSSLDIIKICHFNEHSPGERELASFPSIFSLVVEEKPLRMIGKGFYTLDAFPVLK